MIQTLILSYVNKYNRIDLEEIRLCVNEPVSLIAREVAQLYKEKYLQRSEQGYSLTEKGLQQDVDLWNVWIEESDDDDWFSIEENVPLKVNEKGIPIFDDIKDLRKALKLDHVNIDAYHMFNISKGHKNRVITAPSKKLKKRHRWILEYILKKTKLPNCVHGFVENKSIVTNAESHINKRVVGCLDIKNFFPSITVERVVEIFKEIGYKDDISEELGKICTYNGVLPQGAPSSPMLANLVLKSFDLELLEYCNTNSLTYTRYADDITISGDDEIDGHIEKIRQMLKQHGFEINDEKTHIMRDNYRKMVTGLVVSDTVKVPKSYKRTFRQEIYYCRKFGVEQHLRNNGRISAVNFKEYMYGKAYFIKMVEEEVGESFLKQLDIIFSAYN